MEIQELAELYHQQLKDSEDGMAWFKKVGIEEKMVDEFKLGWIEDPAFGHESYRGLPVFPYMTSQGRPMQLRVNAFKLDYERDFSGGVIESVAPDFLPPLHLYNVGHSLPGLRTNRCYLVEDVESCIWLRSMGARAVAAPGFNNWEPFWYQLFLDSEVFIVFGQDREELGLQMMREMRMLGIARRGIRLPADSSFALLQMAAFPPSLDDLEGLYGMSKNA